MKNLETLRTINFSGRGLLTPFLAIILAPLYILVICHKSHGGDLRGTAAAVDSHSSTGVTFQSGKSKTSANTTTRLQGTNRQVIVSGGSYAGFGFVSISAQGEKRLLTENLYKTQPTTKPSKYIYPCATAGTFVIGWKHGIKSKGCDAVVTTASSKSGKRKNLLKSEVAEVAQVSNNAIRYCSAVAESGQWGAVVTNSRWDILSSNDPCKEAVRRCEVNSGSSSCSVVNMGEQDFTELEKELTTVLKCGNDVKGRQRDNPSVLDKWLNEQASGSLKSSGCSLHVLNSDELLVFPTTDQTTVIATGDDIPPFNEPVIVVLAGTVKIVSPNPNVAISERKAQQACYHENPDLLTLGLKQIEGVIQSQQGGTETCAPVSSNQDFPINLEPDTRRTTYTSPPIQSFFTGWSANIADDIQGYQNVVEEEFLTPPATPSPTPIQ